MVRHGGADHGGLRRYRVGSVRTWGDRVGATVYRIGYDPVCVDSERTWADCVDTRGSNFGLSTTLRIFQDWGGSGHSILLFSTRLWCVLHKVMRLSTVCESFGSSNDDTGLI